MARYRMYPTAAQDAGLLEHCSHARYMWNLHQFGQLETYGKASRRVGRDGREYIHQKRRPVRPLPGYVEQARMLTEARAGYGWLAAGPVVVQQQALRDFDQAIRNFYAGTHGRPGRRRRHEDEGFRIVNLEPTRDIRRLNRNWGQVRVPKAGWVRFRWSRRVPDAKSTGSAWTGPGVGTSPLPSSLSLSRLRARVRRWASTGAWSSPPRCPPARNSTAPA